MIVVSHQHRWSRFSRRETFRTIRCVLKGESQERFPVSVVFTDNRYIRSMNKKYLGHDRATDVLAFPLRDGVGVAGEIYVNLDRARRQALDYRVTFGEEVRRLVIHGMLHLLGYDDETDRKARTMRTREDRYVEKLRTIKG
ncbi:MAG: rRNA maturation RNase YbeY [Bacteroidota bacterium]